MKVGVVVIEVTGAFISGNNQVGSEIRCVTIPRGATELEYQWYRSAEYNDEYYEIADATESTYVITTDDIFLMCQVRQNGTILDSPILVVDRTGVVAEVDSVNEEVNSVDSVVGTGLSLDSTISSISGASELTSELERINQSIRLILNTVAGELPMLPDLGCNLYKFMFAPLTDETCSEIQTEISTALSAQEPRINLESVEATINDEIDHTINVRIEYTIKGTNVQGNYIEQIGGDGGG